MPFGICISYLEKCLFISSAHFFNQVDTFICFYGFSPHEECPSAFFFNKGGLVMNTLSFHLFEQVFNCSSLLKASILGWLLKKNILNISSHCLLAYKVSVEKSTNSLMGVPLYVTSHFSLAAFKIFSLTFDNLITICLGVALLGSILGLFQPLLL